DLNDPENFKKEKFQNKVEKMAASLVLIQDDNLLKIHGHTEKTGSLISYCHKYGELIKIKSENMSLQAKERKKSAQSAQSNFAASKSSEEELCGFVSCTFGSEIIKKMK
ncbi:DAK2 domain-containing protein, partial [Mycoplasmopsis synoviae]